MTDVKTGRNEPCHCGSGKKYKQCCLRKDEAAARELRLKAQAAADAAAPVDEAEPKASARTAQPVVPRPTPQPWKRSGQNTRGFSKVSAVRKVGGGG